MSANRAAGGVREIYKFIEHTRVPRTDFGQPAACHNYRNVTEGRDAVITKGCHVASSAAQRSLL